MDSALQIHYEYTPGVQEAAKRGRTQVLYHGCWLQACRNITYETRLRESHDPALGHDFLYDGAGIYTSPRCSTALEYARASVLPFSKSLHRCVFKLKSPPRRNLGPDDFKRKKDGGDQWIF